MSRSGVHAAAPSRPQLQSDARAGELPVERRSRRAAGGVWPEQLRVADEFYVLAHDEGGEPLVHPLLLGLGVAGGLLAELVLAERISVTGPTVAVTVPEYVHEPVSDQLLQLIAVEGAPLRDWLVGLARGCPSWVVGRLAADGLFVRREQRHRRRTIVQFLPVNANRAHWRSVRLAVLLADPGAVPSMAEAWGPADAVVAGLVTAASLLDPVIDKGWPGASRAEARQRVDAGLAALPVELAAVVTAVETAVGDAVLSART